MMWPAAWDLLLHVYYGTDPRHRRWIWNREIAPRSCWRFRKSRWIERPRRVRGLSREATAIQCGRRVEFGRVIRRKVGGRTDMRLRERIGRAMHEADGQTLWSEVDGTARERYCVMADAALAELRSVVSFEIGGSSDDETLIARQPDADYVTAKCLVSSGVVTLSDLAALSRRDLQAVPGLGKQRVALAEGMLRKAGYTLVPRAEKWHKTG